MEKFLTILEILVPILVTLLLGIYARKKAALTAEGVEGLQQFVVRFALPCVLFNSCLTSSFGAETLTSMALLTPLMLLCVTLAFRARRKGPITYHNMPFLFAAQESGMLGIPLFLVLFGETQVFRMAALDLAQAMVAIPVLAILSSRDNETPTIGGILRRVFSSPLLLAALAGIILNLSGAALWLDGIGLGAVIRGATDFLATPVSAVILFTIGYNFSLASGTSRRRVLRVTAVHCAVFLSICALMQAILLLLPDVAAETRWAILLYCLLPGSYLTAGLGKNREEHAFASGVCSLGTAVTMAAFLVIAVLAI